METEQKDETRPMNAWEALTKIVSDLTMCAVFLAVLGVIYLLVR